MSSFCLLGVLLLCWQTPRPPFVTQVASRGPCPSLVWVCVCVRAPQVCWPPRLACEGFVQGLSGFVRPACPRRCQPLYHRLVPALPPAWPRRFPFFHRLIRVCFLVAIERGSDAAFDIILGLFHDNVMTYIPSCDPGSQEL